MYYRREQSLLKAFWKDIRRVSYILCTDIAREGNIEKDMKLDIEK